MVVSDVSLSNGDPGVQLQLSVPVGQSLFTQKSDRQTRFGSQAPIGVHGQASVPTGHRSLTQRSMLVLHWKPGLQASPIVQGQPSDPISSGVHSLPPLFPSVP